MEQSTAHKILDIQEALRSDPAYQALIAEHEVRNTRFLETVNALEKSQRAAIYDYLGLIVEIHTRQLEWACK